MSWPAWIDGEVCASADGLVFEHDLALGTALFETVACAGGQPLRLDAHIERLTRAARSVGRAVPDAEVLRTAFEGLAAALPDGRGAARVTVVGDPPRLYGTTRALPEPPAEGVGLWLAPPSVRRGDPLESIKHTSRADKVRWREHARSRGAWDAVLSNHEGRPVGATVANLWVVRDGCLLTPPIHEGCLPGVTRGAILALADPPLPTRVARVEAGDLEAADEVLTTNCLVGPLGARELLGGGLVRRERPLPGSEGPIVGELRRRLGFP